MYNLYTRKLKKSQVDAGRGLDVLQRQMMLAVMTETMVDRHERRLRIMSRGNGEVVSPGFSGGDVILEEGQQPYDRLFYFRAAAI